MKNGDFFGSKASKREGTAKWKVNFEKKGKKRE